jgi:ubiquinone/menaquinone biosynthesis C-methylase UbiE
MQAPTTPSKKTVKAAKKNLAKQKKSPAKSPLTRTLSQRGVAGAGEKTKKNSATPDGYLHGFTPGEHTRLYHQARFLENQVFDRVGFEDRKQILEIGSGVGAQTEILHERFPRAKITCIDASETQVSMARKHLAGPIKKGLMTVTQANANHLPFKKGTFDAAFITWFLEHVSDPVGILKELKRVMSKNAVIHLNEVLNHSFLIDPPGPAISEYWAAYNEHQISLKGDPFVGAKLGNYLQKAGFQEITTNFVYWHLDCRQSKLRGQFLNYFIDLLLSGSTELVKSKKVTKTTVKQMTAELNALRKNPDCVLFLGFVQARATVL